MAAPTLSSATIESDGLTLTTVWSEAVMHRSGAVVLSIVSVPSITNTVTYSSGDGSTTLVYRLDTAYPVRDTDTVTVTFPASSVQSSGFTANAVITDAAVTNNSGTEVPACTGKATGMMRNACAVLRPAYSQSATSAGLKTLWSIPYDNVCCSIQARSSGETAAYAARMPVYDYKGYFTTSATFAVGDRIINVTNPRGQTDRVYQVVGVDIDHSGRTPYQFLRLKELDGNE